MLPIRPKKDEGLEPVEDMAPVEEEEEGKEGEKTVKFIGPGAFLRSLVW